MTLFCSQRYLVLAFCLVTFAVLFVFHTYPLGLSDFWWHLNTGRWIWANGGMPSEDPFLYSSPASLNADASLILRGYPLSQLLFFGVYSMGGIYALLLLKGMLMTLFYGLMWGNMRRNGLHPVLALAAVGLLPLMFFRFDELRPQLFSFIGTIVVLLQAESLLASERQGKRLEYAGVFFLPLFMLVWANLHRGYIIGIGILLIHLFSEWIARRRGKYALPDSAFRRFAMIVFLSTGISFLNPAGATAIWASFTELSGPFAVVVDEFFGTLKYFEFFGIRHIGYLIVSAAVIPSLALMFKWRELRLADVLILVFFLLAGILSFRFSLLMVAVVWVISARYFAQQLNGWLSRGKGIPMVLLWCLSTAFLASPALSRTSLAGSPLENGVIPSAAVDYLEQSGINGNIYNPFEYGGYLSWRLYPRQIFTDQRNLSWDAYEEYSQVWRGDYDPVFRKYQVGAVFYTVYDAASGRPSRLMARLLSDDRWNAGYYDGRRIVFVRADLNPQQPYLDKQVIVQDILRRLQR